MPLPAPNLDDRRFQELVDDAKRMVQQRCPGWTDHNVSDPGVTLIELFAWMTDLLLYRLNRVPDRNYVKFLELLGVRLYPATPAHVGVTFWLSGAIEQRVGVPAGTQVSTAVASVDDPVIFRTVADLVMPPCQVVSVKVERAGDGTYDESEILKGAGPFDAFHAIPKVGDVVLLGLSDALPSCAVRLDLDCRVEGVGVDPEFPPLVWEAWDGKSWIECDLDSDTTGGLNQWGAVVLHLPADHAVSVIDRQPAGWLRCRVLAPEEEQPFYTASPEIVSVTAHTVGGTTTAVNATEVTDEIVGMSEGVPGQRFTLAKAPVLAGEERLEVEVAAGPGWERWTQVDDFAEQQDSDNVFVLDHVSGEIRFGPSVRMADGSVHQYGAVPPKGSPIRIPRYLTGGGTHGNVAARTVTQMMTAIPLVDRVVNRRSASGGVDVESVDNARERGPISLRTRNRAVTAEDYEHLAKGAAPELARVRCEPAGDGGEPGVARVLVVPAVTTGDAQLRFEEFIPAEETLARVAEHLDERLTIGARVVVEPPLYLGVTIVATVRAKRTANPQRLHDAAVAALYGYFHPTVGGPDGDGWPFGRSLHVGEVYAVLQGLDGTEFVEEALLFAADPITGERGDPTERLELDSNALLFSYEHRVRVESG
ncbi:MAG: putative baseplate assembly protein [Actinobacteria bacterium]|nr:putative baseplate assembly protein [Actinomycetota bacterium]